MKKVNSPDNMWYQIENIHKISSPALLVYPDRIEQNIQKMVMIAGNVDMLKPHVKTHKMPEVIRMQMKYGINKFKCATISETEMVAKCGATDILLAIQPVGPNLGRFIQLQKSFAGTKISCIADSEEVIRQLSDMSVKTDQKTHVWLDINNGMNRTGITPGIEAVRLYKLINSLPMMQAEGFHVYDGHIHDADYALRQKKCNDSFSPVLKMIDELKSSEIAPVKIVAGGTPTFPVHASRKDVELSPGTILLWDYGYSSFLPDMDYLHAAILITRIISKPGKDLLCLDMGHKAVASEMPQPRIKILGLDDYTITGHNEEHMVIRTTKADNYKTGDLLYCIPWHICPTVDRYDTVSVVNENMVTGQWNVEARKREITI